MRAVMFGPPGVGKGTQGSRLAREMGIPHLAMGDILRAAVAAGTPLGRKAKQYMDTGKLVPDGVVVGLIEERITTPEAARGFILDGFPRNLAQAEALDAMLARHGLELDRVIFMEASEAKLIERLAGRLLCRACGSVFNRHYSPPREEGRCDRCGGELYQRDDDREAVIAERLAVYRHQTQPLLNYYGAHPGFRRVDGDGDVEAVYAQLQQVALD